MNIPDGLFFDMDTQKLSAHGRLLLIDCLRRANKQYAEVVEDLSEPRAIRLIWSQGNCGMTRPAFAKARKELMRAGFLKRFQHPKTKKPSRDWFFLRAA